MFAEKYLQAGDRKITLNFALAKGMPVDPQVMLAYFDPQKFLIKVTPVNPTCQAVKHGLASYVDPHEPGAKNEIAHRLVESGYEVIVSIGEAEENKIGSNCGQYVLKYLEGKTSIEGGYTYQVEDVS